MSIVSYPTPLYSNPAIEPQFYTPNKFNINAISQALIAVVTTSLPHEFVIGQEVRFIIFESYGMRQLNGRSALVISIPATDQVEVNIDTRFFDPFVNSGTNTPSQIIAIGEINSGVINSSFSSQETFIPGSFRNISPN